MQSPLFSATKLSARTIGLIVIIVAIALILLLANRLGGPSHQNLEPINSSLHDGMRSYIRGETVTTTTNEFASYRIDGTIILLDQNTSLLFDDGRKEQETFTFLDGRIVVSGDATFTSRVTTIVVDGLATLVHYPWLDKIQISVLEGTVIVYQPERGDIVIAANEAREIDTLPPTDEPKKTLFSLEAPSVVNFYTWVGEQLGKTLIPQTPDGAGE